MKVSRDLQRALSLINQLQKNQLHTSKALSTANAKQKQLENDNKNLSNRAGKLIRAIKLTIRPN